MSTSLNSELGAKIASSSEFVDFSQYIHTIKRYALKILSLAILITILVTLIVLSMTPKYIAKASILIESDQANVLSIEEVYGLDASKKEYYETQYEILRSRKIAEKVVRKMALQKHQLFNQDMIEAQKSPLQQIKENVSIWAKEQFPFLPQNEQVLETEIEREARLFGFAVTQLRRAVTITPVRNTQVVTISVEIADPELAALIANTVGEIYIENYLEAKLDMTAKATTWLTDRLQGLRTNLVQAEQRLTEFYEREQVVNIDGVLGLASDELQQLTGQLLNAQNALKRSESVYEQINSGNASLEELASLPEVLNHPSIQNVKREEVTAESKVSELGEVYGPKHPRMIAANAELRSVRESLNNQIRSLIAGINTEYLSAQNKVKILERSMNTAKDDFRRLSSLENQRKSLQREVDINQQMYNSFFTRLKETSEIGGFESANARLLDAAEIPTVPAKPNKTIIVVAAFVLSLGFGTFLALVLDALDSGIRSVDDVERKLGQRLLGIIPWQPHKKKVNLDVRHFFDTSHHMFSEAVRTLRTSLQLLNIDKPSKTILVTSSVPKEGKSTVAVNLAFAIGQLNKVLLIDTDLRRPAIAKLFDLPGFQPGISNVLAGTHAIEECIVTDEQSGVDVICAGTIPPNPQELLASNKFKDLMKSFEDKYDHIIVDSAPTQAVSDAVVVSSTCDSLVYVVKADSTSYKVINNGLSRFMEIGHRVDGIVLNQVDLRRAKKSGDYAGFYDQYGYNSYSKESKEA
ncbi:MAG: exopolysaccharide regulatory tyrosine autokinase VpsO [Aliiglaciecola sp.]